MTPGTWALPQLILWMFQAKFAFGLNENGLGLIWPHFFLWVCHYSGPSLRPSLLRPQKGASPTHLTKEWVLLGKRAVWHGRGFTKHFSMNFITHFYAFIKLTASLPDQYSHNNCYFVLRKRLCVLHVLYHTFKLYTEVDDTL